MSYIIVCLIIGLILMIHEAGHFAAARLAKIPVARFSVGLGPRLGGINLGGADFCISLIPFGGYVLPKAESEDDFYRIPPWKRIIFSLGGPLANILSVLPMLAVFNTVTKGASPAGILIHPFLQTGIYISRILSSIPILLNSPEHLSGVVGIVSAGSQVAGAGAIGFLVLAAFLSINLAVLNLLPIPALDGGQMVMTALEAVWPKSTKVRMPLALVGWLFLISIMVYATTRDISRLLG